MKENGQTQNISLSIVYKAEENVWISKAKIQAKLKWTTIFKNGC